MPSGWMTLKIEIRLEIRRGMDPAVCARANAASKYLNGVRDVDADGSHVADVVDAFEQIAHVIRRARASIPQTGGQDEGTVSDGD